MSEDGVHSLPIDIHYNKLLDWLVNRRHCNQQWQIAAVEIRQKINAAIKDMPEVEELSKLVVEEANINYFHCLKILKLLKDTETGKKTIFGQYASQRLKDWSEIIKLYEKDGVYLAEMAQMVIRNVNYEVPALKKQIARCQQTQKDCTRKESDYVNNAADLRRKYEASCKQLGIEGKKIKSELSALVRDLPSEYNRIAKITPDLNSTIEYYENFTKFVLNRDDLGAVSVPMLQHVMAHGNTTTYQWKYGKKPEHIEESAIFIDTADEQDVENPGTIDWVDDGAEGGSEAVDFGDNIDFDISEITIEDAGIELERQAAVADKTGAGDAGSDADSLVAKGIAKGDNALTILDNPETRNEFVNDLYELEAFLTQRLNEVKNEDGALSGSQFQSAPQSIQIDPVSIATMLSDVRSIVNQLTSVQMQHLMLIRDSPRYVDRLRDNLKQTLHLAEKMLFYEKDMIVKRKEALQEQSAVEPRLDAIIENTKTMQKQMEDEISKKYKGRIVNIMGEINTM
ncbi:CDK5 regulatory subunit-associated protein 3-like [Gigantopelta aegis]|uniref:CDK5 regulatory subunit-associated protein 3-like n=1 Tax=Gigantopelta aegis TaxID=1735272 RepID=UPI001B887867|nr:CDK5 regulatory subunit-associated protein 3-like [Gigantopelta aegis]XP_041371769.1 CDK5 regulatory subunit-associated protein 3-like [Gigantopelta aegis]XP_041371770.1 CDK5 regulatory subunit-associated protein 3-like [Gigantopelta aegis]